MGDAAPGPKILIIDDDRELNSLLAQFLPRYGYEVLTATRPDEGLALLKESRPSLLILDVMLPGKSGMDLCAEIRRSSQVPIIMLTARGATNDRIRGLELGADDYLPKPYDPRELVARIQSILRRAKTGAGDEAQESAGAAAGQALGSGAPAEELDEERIGDLVIDWVRGAARIGDRDLNLTTAEFEILSLLVRNAGRTLSRDEIAQAVRGSAWDAVDRSIDVLVSRVRHKLGDDSRHPRYLKTMWGDGYRFVAKRAKKDER